MAERRVMGAHKYRVTYNFERHQQGLTAEEVKERGVGGTDAIVVCSIIRGDDGGVSYAWPSLDGETGEPVTSLGLFKLWSILAYRLMNDEELGKGQRQLCFLVHEEIRRAILGADEE